MTDLEYKEFVKRYEKFKDCNLPVPFWDEERQVREFVYYDKNYYSNNTDDSRNYIVNHNLSYALEDIAMTSLYYSFNCGAHQTNEDGTFKFVVGHNHAHSLEEVVERLYEYPESFSIPPEDEEHYTKRELRYLKDIQNYLLSIGLKDMDEPKFDSNGEYIRDMTRYQNENRK